jgi:hypothetical protein
MAAAQQWLTSTWDTVLAAYAAEVSKAASRAGPPPGPHDSQGGAP